MSQVAYPKAEEVNQDRAIVESDRSQISQSLGIDPKNPRTAPVVRPVQFADGTAGVGLIDRPSQSEEGKTRWTHRENIKRRLKLQNIRPATVINMNPWPIRVNGVHFSSILPSACPDDKDFSVHVIRHNPEDPVIDWADTGDAKYMPSELVPIVLAKEFEQGQYLTEGGVVAYEGDHDPLRDPEVVGRMKEARDRMERYMIELYTEAQGLYMQANKVGIGNIGVKHRKAGAYLFRRRLISEKPAWLEITRAESDIAEPCPRCKAEPKKGAYGCPECGYIFDPEQAYLKMEIAATDISLARLPRKKLEELGITEEQQPETMEERAAKIAQAKKAGDKKPKGAKENATHASS
jgi:hypothetical protein